MVCLLGAVKPAQAIYGDGYTTAQMSHVSQVGSTENMSWSDVWGYSSYPCTGGTMVFYIEFKISSLEDANATPVAYSTATIQHRMFRDNSVSGSHVGTYAEAVATDVNTLAGTTNWKYVTYKIQSHFVFDNGSIDLADMNDGWIYFGTYTKP